MTSRGVLRTSFFRGFAAPADKATLGSYVVARDDKTKHFVMIEKCHVKPSKLTQQTLDMSTNKCPTLCHRFRDCPQGATCKFLHAKDEPITLTVQNNDELLVSIRNGSSTRLPPSRMEVTAGLMFVSTMRQMGLVRDILPWVCDRRLYGTCPNGERCLLLHVPPESINFAECGMPTRESHTPIAQALRFACVTTPGLQNFIDNHLPRLGLRCVGDLAGLSTVVFEGMANSDVDANPENRESWLILIQFRQIERDMAIGEALGMFHGVETSGVEPLVRHGLANVGDLLQVRAKMLYSFPLKAQVLDACEKVRARFENDGPAYKSVTLADQPATGFFNRFAAMVTGFRATHAHKSWRKQDATRPIVTSAITYVDPDLCRCHKDKKPAATAPPKSPKLGPSAPPSRQNSAPREDDATIAPNHWCRCPRKYQIAVNYELSTPSGSRCSEQNALGMLASMGLPTHCVREVFVHGDTHDGADPNPLFPCGVCENMFRRVSKDVQKLYGGDVMLYMFDQYVAPKKLVSLPVSEMSHRAGSHFKRFVEEDLRDDGTMYTTPSMFLSETHGDAQFVSEPPQSPLICDSP